jgi:DNA-directed RNA polymerase subunit D
MEIIKKTNDKLIFKADIEESLANAIRRYVHQIDVVAVDNVEISRNDSPLYDETIAHRIGLIPLKQNKKEGTMKVKSNKEGFVYSGEFEGDIKVIYDKMPITLLNKGQELEIVATVKVGKGAEHSKFSPGLLFYRKVLELTMDKNIADRIKQISPDSEIKIKGNKAIVLDDKEKEIYDFCEGISEKEGKEIEVKPLKEIIINIDSFGQMEPKEIFVKSINALKKDLEDFAKKISK